MAHCSKCCEVTPVIRAVGLGLDFLLAGAAVMILAPDGWSAWEMAAATVVVVGLWK